MKNKTGKQLTDRHRIFVCQHLAEFRSPAEVVELVIAEYGNFGFGERRDDLRKWLLERVRYVAYDPDAAKWHKMIRKVRDRWREGILEEALANRRQRVRYLVRNVERIEQRLGTAGNLPSDRKAQKLYADVLTDLIKEQAALLDQIAQEAGQKVERSKSEQDLNVNAASAIPVELRMPDFRQQETDGTGT